MRLPAMPVKSGRDATLNFEKLAKQIPTLVSALPSSGTEGEEIYLQTPAMGAAGSIWHLRYRATSGSSYRWEYLGGAPLISEVFTEESVESAVYGNLATVGPAVVLPAGGDYIVTLAADSFNNTAGQFAAMSYAIGATAATDADRFESSLQANSYQTRSKLKTGLTAVTLTAKYRASANKGTWKARTLSVLPVRLG